MIQLISHVVPRVKSTGLLRVHNPVHNLVSQYPLGEKMDPTEPKRINALYLEIFSARGYVNIVS